MSELRPYQAKVVAEIDRVIASGKHRIILVAPTGAGKTVMAAAIVKATISAKPGDQP